ncbi:flagellar basal body-associated protein FliL [Aestuariibius sp. 2305UL40-4]|uniref:flagellar basal body-associated FliL family protein n=1 Tax=Aestuariibius violaceus TaxID=3234132 RepID=UPI00345F1163
MSDEAAEPEPQKKSKMPLVLGVVAGLAGAGGGFYAAWSGLLMGPEMEEKVEDHGAPMPDMPAFVALDPLIISLPPQSPHKHLRFRAHLEVAPDYQAEVAALSPRVIDVLHDYLSALEPAELQEPAALTTLRGQMLRRLRVVAGEGRIRDVLIAEFVLD